MDDQRLNKIVTRSAVGLGIGAILKNPGAGLAVGALSGFLGGSKKKRTRRNKRKSRSRSRSRSRK